MLSGSTLFILPTYGHFDYAKRCVASLVKHTPANTYSVAIIDDGSPEWPHIDFATWPSCPKFCGHFLKNDGLTRSWNTGLQYAKTLGFEYTICGNSDLLFTENWLQPLKNALNEFDLVGPVTNAPGHAPWQNVSNYCLDVPFIDDTSLHEVSAITKGYSNTPCKFINGFFMMAKTKTWWDGAFNENYVFNPRYKLTGNEDELQQRWRERNFKIGFVPESYIFHYRSVSRPEALSKPESKGAFRSTFNVEYSSRNCCIPATEHN